MREPIPFRARSTSEHRETSLPVRVGGWLRGGWHDGPGAWLRERLGERLGGSLGERLGAWRRLGVGLTPRAFVGLTLTMLLSGALMVLLLSRLIGASQMVASVPPYPLIGHPAPDFTVALWSGSTSGQSSLRLADLKGKVVVLNFWASWCDTCALEEPDLQRAYEQYGTQGVVVVGLAYNDTSEHGKPFLQKYGVTYPTGPASPATAVAYGVAGPPETVFIGRDGKIVSKAPGGVDRATLDATLRGMLK